MQSYRSAKRLIAVAGAAACAILISGCNKPASVSSETQAGHQHSTAQAPAAKKDKVELVHVHGLAYSPDGSKLLIPSHFGLAVFDGEGWSKAPGPQHDYMGFSATANAMYSSGHPAPDSGLVNPFGLIKSTDGGQTWQKLGMEGESDFHYLATGYQTNAVYVVNHHPNSKMKQPGIYSTRNDGFSWQLAASRGLEGPPSSIAVHPTNPDMVAAGMKTGLYLSENGGNDFQQVFDNQVLAVLYDLDGKHLWFSTIGEKPLLVKVALGGEHAEKIELPAMEKDAVAYIAQNPARKNEYAIATFGRSVFVTPDAGKQWKQIAHAGEGR